MKKQFAKLALTATLGLAITFTLGCGNHTWEDILFGSSSSEEEISSSSLSSSSSRASSSSSGPVEAWRKYLYTPQTRLENISTYNVEVKEYKVTVEYGTSWFEKDVEKETTVYYVLPKRITADTKVLLGMHGSGVEDSSFAKALRYIPEKENIAIVAPLWSGGSATIAANPDKIFEDFVERFGLKAKKYILYGFSAGGNFTSRYGQISDSKYIDYVINHSPAYWTEFVCGDANLCSNATTASKYESVVLRNLENRKTYILIGSNETTRDRLANAIKLFETGKAYSEANNIGFSWKLFAMEGVGHSATYKSPLYILDILKGIAD